ncbi:MAG TPA: hypothetical protein VE890_07290, partial [Thermoguttaceae bacterium]|nr:hypothetical protein [Thermoguttaceae bacterium]
KLVPYVADAVPGWMQTCLTLYDAQGKEVAYVDDFRFHPDPVLIYEVEKDGPYVLEIRDVIYRGREDMAYRLSIGVLPYLTHIYPLGSQRGSATDVRLYGANLEKETLSVTPTADGPRVQPVQVTSQGLSSNPRSFAAGTIDEAEDAEPNDSIDEPQRVTLPTTVNGHIGAPGDTDCFVFAAKANQRVFLDVQARRLGSPVDSILTLFDPNGREVIENDDSVDKSSPLITHHADSRLNYLCTTEGDYTLRLRDIQGKGGEEYTYRLSIGSTTPDFDLLIIPDNPRVGKGGTVALTAKALRTWGAWGDITLSVQGLPDGFAVSDAAITARQNEVHLTLTAPADAPLGVVTPTFIGTGTFGQKTVVRNAVGAEAIMQAFIYWHDVPTEEFLLAVLPEAQCTLATDRPAGEVLQIVPGATAKFNVKATRTGDLKGAIKLAAEKLPNGITVKVATIAADKDEAEITVTTTKQTVVGLKENVVITGTIKVDKDTLTCAAPAVPIEIIAEPEEKK